MLEQHLAFFILRAINLVTETEFADEYVNTLRALGSAGRNELGLDLRTTPSKPKTAAVILGNMFPTVDIFISIFVVISYFMFVLGGFESWYKHHALHAVHAHVALVCMIMSGCEEG